MSRHTFWRAAALLGLLFCLLTACGTAPKSAAPAQSAAALGGGGSPNKLPPKPKGVAPQP